LEEVWIQLRGIPPKWCERSVFDWFASSYGLLEDVDWQGIFSSLYKVVRMKIRCRDPAKIPRDMLFYIEKKLYKIAITVEIPSKKKREVLMGVGVVVMEEMMGRMIKITLTM
jgi:hypothetical protein